MLVLFLSEIPPVNFIMQLIRLLDIEVFYFINHVFKNAMLDFLMPILTEMGSARFTFGMGLLCLFFRKKEIKLTGIFLLAAAFIGNNLIGLLKDKFMIPRPFIALGDVYNFIQDGGYAFPSGHASNAFLSATILSLQFRQELIFYLLALSVAFSRVYLGVHYPSDVIVGAALGLLIGYFFVFLYRRLENPSTVSAK